MVHTLESYVFIGVNASAHTTDPTGKNLPADHAPWRYITKVDVGELSGSRGREILNSLNTDGLFVIEYR
jgi:hypothetical protein